MIKPTKSNDQIDWKSRCEELAKKNVELTAQVKSLEAVTEKLKAEAQKWKSEFDNTVAIHNSIRDQLMTALSQTLNLASNSRFLNSVELEQQRAQVAAMKAELVKEKQGP